MMARKLKEELANIQQFPRWIRILIGVDTPHGDGLLVVHAMPLREKHRPHYEEAKRWRKVTPQRDELKAKQSGTTITAALVDELSQEAEAGYDLTRAEHRRVG